MSTEYGEKLTLALRAVYQLHADTSRFLVDFDNERTGAGWKSVFGNVATSSMSSTLTPDPGCWMAEGVYRYYVRPPALDTVEGLLVPFFHFQKSKEPLLVVAQIKYQADGKALKNVCGPWDIWDLYYNWNDRQDLERVITSGTQDKDRIEWAKLIAVPLYSINRVGDAEALVDRVKSLAVSE